MRLTECHFVCSLLCSYTYRFVLFPDCYKFLKSFFYRKSHFQQIMFVSSEQVGTFELQSSDAED